MCFCFLATGEANVVGPDVAVAANTNLVRPCTYCCATTIHPHPSTTALAVSNTHQEGKEEEEERGGTSSSRFGKSYEAFG